MQRVYTQFSHKINCTAHKKCGRKTDRAFYLLLLASYQGNQIPDGIEAIARFDADIKFIFHIHNNFYQIQRIQLQLFECGFFCYCAWVDIFM